MEILHLPAIIIASWDTQSLIYGIFYADAFQQLSLILFSWSKQSILQKNKLKQGR